MKYNIKDKVKKHPALLCLMVLMFVSTVLYWKYISLQKLYVFTDCANDSYTQTYPALYSAINYIKSGYFPIWSFKNGLGAKTEVSIFDLPLALVKINYLPYAMGWLQYFRVIIAGMLFFSYFKLLKKDSFVCIVGAICYAFSGQMIIRASWASYPIEVILAAMLLIGFELLYQKKTFGIWLAILAFFSLNVSVYQMILYSAVIFTYAFMRYASESRILSVEFVKKASMYVGSSLFISFCIKYKNVISTFAGLTENQRFVDGVSRVSATSSDKIQLLTPINELAVAYCRTISMDAIGITDDFTGIIDFLDDPTFYATLLVLILIPQFFCLASKRKRIVYGIGVTGSFIYLLCPVVRYFANGFGLESYKLSSFWIIILYIFIAIDALNLIINERKINTVVLLITNIVNAIILLAIRYTYPQYISKRYILLICGFFLLYSMLLYVLVKIKKKCDLFKLALLGIVIFEVTLMSWRCINDRGTMPISEINEKVGYNDYVNDAVEIISEEESDLFYRIDNQTRTWWNDSKVKGYYGTTYYAGGTKNYGSIKKFVDSIEAPLGENNARFVSGFSGINEVNTLLGVKYILSYDAAIPDYGYELVEQVGNIKVYKNRYSIPIAYTFDSFISTEEYMELDTEQRRKALINTCVIDDSVELEKWENVDNNEREGVNLVDIDEYKVGEGIMLPQYTDDDVLLVTLTMDSPKAEQGWLVWDCRNENGEDEYHKVQIISNENKQQYMYEINCKNIQWFQVVYSSVDTISQVNVSSVDREEYYEQYRNSVEKLNKNEIKLIEFKEDYLKGEITLDSNKELFFSIPYDKNWKLYVDGEEQSLVQADIMFMASYIESGTHTIELKYVDNYRKIIINIYILISLILILELIFVRMKTKERGGK